MTTLHGEREIGVILKHADVPAETPDVRVEFEYDGVSKLVVTLHNISMNAAARGVIGSSVVQGREIIIKPRERYDQEGPVESLKRYTIRYTMLNVPPGIYVLLHDDSAAEGQDRVVRLRLDLSKATKGGETVSFKSPGDMDDPFAPRHGDKGE